MAKSKEAVKAKESGKKENNFEGSKAKVVAAGVVAGVLVVAVAVALILANSNTTDTDKTGNETSETAVEQPEVPKGETEASEEQAEGQEQMPEEQPAEVTEQPTEVATGTPATNPVEPVPSTPVVPKSYTEAVNGATLRPQSTGYALLDNQVMAIINGYTNNHMQVADKIEALYRWTVGVIMTTEEDVTAEEVADVMGRSGYSAEDGRAIYLAYKAIETGKATPEQRAALLFVMLRKLGLEAYMADTEGMVVVRAQGAMYSFEPARDKEIGERSVEYMGRDVNGVALKAFGNFAK